MIIYPETFKTMLPAGFDGVFDWDFLLPAFAGTKIEPMDIDFLIERHGRILILETKSPEKQVPQGQKLTLRALLALGKGKLHVMIIYGKTPETIKALEEWRYRRGSILTGDRQECDANYVLQRVTDWFQWANSKNSQ